jgi:hypothetical protein
LVIVQIKKRKLKTWLGLTFEKESLPRKADDKK